MDKLIIEKTNDTPSVVLDYEAGKIEIAERSLPENAIDFYSPIIDWFNEYSKNPNKETVVNFKLEYFNTSSAKQIAKILLILQKLAENNDVLIKWYYSKNDSDMHSSGIRYSKLVKVKFEFIEIA
jgi:hypothetical protein